MNRAFLSHSSAQKDFVRKVYKELGAARCVFDECCFENGKAIMDEIIRTIQKTDIFVLFISNEALNSEWVQQEIVLADNLLKKYETKQILPILIDKNINPAADIRIPDWIRKILMKPVSNPQKARSMVSNALRQLEMETNPIYRAKRNLFFGRYQEKGDLETELNMHIDPFYNTIIVSGMEGIGRRTFLQRFFAEKQMINPSKEPTLIKMQGRDSIDNLILYFIELKRECVSSIDIEDISQKTIEEKTSYLKELIKEVANENEYIFIIDDGCIVRPTLDVADWFLEATDIPEMKDSFFVSVISRFRPSNAFLARNESIISVFLDALSPQETRNLFIGYSKAIGLNSDSKLTQISEILNGIPSQVYFAVGYIYRVGVDQAIRNKDIIYDYGDKPVVSIISDIKQRGLESFQLLTLICELQTTSYDMIYEIAGNNDFVNKELEYFFVCGVFALFGANKEYIEVHYSIADYMKRSRINIKEEYAQKLNDSVERFIEKQEENIEFTDMSVLYHDIKGAILDGKELSSKYYLPSFTLNAISELYNSQHYSSIVRLVDKMLQKSLCYDKNTIREYKYWLCLSLARMQDARFEKEINYFFDSTDYYFLFGFYMRMRKNLVQAEKFLKQAFERNPSHQRTMRELVNIYIMRGNYSDGLRLAEQNYEKQKTNIFHIQAYFICLLHKNIDKIDSVKDKLENLLQSAENSFHKKAKNIATTMNGEYAYYVENNKDKAINILKSISNDNVFAKKALVDIYNKEGDEGGYSELKENMKSNDIDW